MSIISPCPTRVIAVDLLKNKRCWNQVLSVLSTAVPVSGRIPDLERSGGCSPQASCHLSLVFPQFYRESSAKFPLSLKFVSKWKNLPSQCKRMLQLPTIFGPAVHRGKDTTHETFLNTLILSWRVRSPNNVGRAVQNGPTLLRYASTITEQKKCWELFAQKFNPFQTSKKSVQKSVQTDATCMYVCM